MPQIRRTPEYRLLETQDEITALCAECQAEGRFAFDTEFVMEDRFESEVCLIQLATAHSVALIDPFLKLDIAPIWRLVVDPAVETVVHAGQEDLALCVQNLGAVPRRVFDLQIAYGLVSCDYPLSLQKLVQSALHIRLHKSKTLTDWRRRPLGTEQLRYAAEDVAYLLPIHDKAKRKLKRLGRTSWARAEFAKFEDIQLYHRAVEDKLSRVKGAGALKARELAVLRALLDWRDTTAEGLNRPARTVLRDHLLVEIARTGISSSQELRDLRGFNLSTKNTRGLSAAIREAQALPQDQWPEVITRDTETPQETALIALATALLRGYCLENSLAYSLVATKKSIRDLIRSQGNQRDGSGELGRGWRSESAGALLREVLAGERVVTVQCANGQYKLTTQRQ